MSEAKKEGLFKRLFGSRKTGCCDIQIQEVKPQTNEEEPDSTSSPGCCSAENSQAR